MSDPKLCGAPLNSAATTCQSLADRCTIDFHQQNKKEDIMTNITRSLNRSYNITGLTVPAIAKIIPDYDLLDAALEALEDHGFLFVGDAPGWTYELVALDWSDDPDAAVADLTVFPPEQDPTADRIADDPDWLADREADRYEQDLNRMAP